MLCPSCLGVGWSSNGGVCEECQGAKELPQPRCPMSTLSGVDGQMGFQAYSQFKNYKILPCAGGLNDQTQYFLNLLAFCDKVSSALEERRDEKNEMIRSMAEKTKKPGGAGSGR